MGTDERHCLAINLIFQFSPRKIIDINKTLLRFQFSNIQFEISIIVAFKADRDSECCCGVQLDGRRVASCSQHDGGVEDGCRRPAQ